MSSTPDVQELTAQLAQGAAISAENPEQAATGEQAAAEAVVVDAAAPAEMQQQQPPPPQQQQQTVVPPLQEAPLTPQESPQKDDNNNPVEKNKIWCRLLIPSKVAGAIIGKGGATIKSLREEFNAIINIPEARAPERVLKICVTSREKLDLLISRIAEILKDEIMKSGIRRKEGETELRILVQSSQAGAIIGTKGTTVKTLRESTGSRININPECCPNSTERVAAIMGRPETVVKCISMIYDILDKVPPKGSEQRYDPNCFDPNYDYGGFGYDPRARPPYPHIAFPFVPHHSFGPRYPDNQAVYPGPNSNYNQNTPTYGSRFQPPSAASPPEFVPHNSATSHGGSSGGPRGANQSGAPVPRGFNSQRPFNARPRGPGPR